VPILARDVMKSPVVSVHPSTRLTELEDTLIARHIGGAPVIENGKLVGIVSRTDIIRYFAVQRSLAQLLGHRAESTSAEAHEDAHLTVRDIMAKETVVVEPDTPIEQVARTMVARRVHRILVTERGAVVGLISSLDVTQLVAEDKLRPA
jgi:CBS domain-containing protein